MGLSERRQGRGRRWTVRAHAALRAVRSRLERLVLPAAPDPSHRTDFRRVVSLVAVLAVGFFGPSLPLARVPVDLWVPYLVIATLAGIILAGSFFIVAPTRIAVAVGVSDAFIVSLLGWLFQGYYHEVGLLFMLVVAALSVVHGLRAALSAVALGAVLVPVLVQPSVATNPTDPVYAGIYLFGAAVVPWTAARLAERRALALRRQLHATRVAEREAVLILARAAEAKDEATGDHVARVGSLTAGLAGAIGMPDGEIDGLRFASMLHDVGKLHVPDSILLKPGPLTSEEWAIIEQHTIWGERILGRHAGFETARVIARSHHENWDGTGYPDRLRGEQIPLAARLVRLADVFDALANARPYKPAWPFERCLEVLEEGCGRAFDPDLGPLFIALLQRWRPATVRAGTDDPRLAADFAFGPAAPAPSPPVRAREERAKTHWAA